MKLLRPVISVLALGLVACTVNADGLKIGVIDVQQIMQKSPQIIAINAQLNKQFKPRQDKLAAAAKELQSETDQLNRGRATMSADDRNKLQNKIIIDRANLDTSGLNFKNDLAAAQNQALQSFMSKLAGVVDGLAKSGKYDLILQRNGLPYVNSNLDLTSQVLKGLG
jgi:outer membrane protein